MKYPQFTGNEPCRSMPIELYYPENGSPHKTVVALCNVCDVLEQCRMWGLRHESFGLWGGLTEQDRQRMRRALNIILEPLPLYQVAGDQSAA